LVLVAIGLMACQAPHALDRRVISSSERAGGANGSNGSGGRSSAPPSDAATALDAGVGSPDTSGSSVPPPVDTAPVLLEQGRGCTSNAACASGLCVDGFCCNSACQGSCQACDAPGKEGSCTLVPLGQDPDDECAMQPAASCGLDGTCDGQGNCARYPAGAECIPGSCSAGVERASGACNGTGTCMMGATQSCPSGVCNGASCGATCTASSQCQPGFYCEGGNCRLKLAIAAACTSSAACASGHCVDGVCCATECTQSCYACNLAGSAGSCVAIPDAQDPSKECIAEGPATCGRAGGCNGRGGCKLQPAGTACGAASCTAAVEIAAKICNGAGACEGGATKACGDFACKGTACATGCDGVADCRAGLVCNDGLCVMPPAGPVAKLDALKVNDGARASGWSMQKDFQIGAGGAHPWSDYGDSYVTSMDAAANILLGAEWVKVATESKKYSAGPQATITLKAAADVYLAIDDRWGDKPGWLAGWADSGWNLRVFESTSKSFPFSLWVKKAQTGTVSLPAINDNDAYDYFVVVK
jgi:hypothetical protein